MSSPGGGDDDRERGGDDESGSAAPDDTPSDAEGTPRRSPSGPDRPGREDDGRSADDGEQSQPPDGATESADDELSSGPPRDETSAAGSDETSTAGRHETSADGDNSAPSPEEWRSDGTRENSPPTPESESDREPSGATLFLYDLTSSVLAVMVVGAYLFAVSGIWPPLVAVESKSMVPNMQVNDLVFVMEEERFPGEDARAGTGVVTARAAGDDSYQKFGTGGDVIVFRKNGDAGETPIIHRAMFWVEEGENWVDPPSEGGTGKADPAYLGGGDDCADYSADVCPAPSSGFVTKGDHNSRYDQVNGLSAPVDPDWVIGTAEFRIPGLGWVRLATQS